MSLAEPIRRADAPETSAGGAELAAEWERIDLLGHLLSDSRRGVELSPDALARLRALQGEVETLRAQHPGWRAVAVGEDEAAPPAALGAVEHDLVACAVAPEAEPRLGLLFQHLQHLPSVASQPYPTPALVQELLAIDAGSSRGLYQALAGDAPLRRRRLLSLPETPALDPPGPFSILKPGPGVAGRLLGRPETVEAPPGAVRVLARPSWDRLVLPPDRLAALSELLLWVRHRQTVEGEWGAEPAGGPIALFSGPSGTGKSFAVAVLAAELGWDLYRVDLGRLVSKYIGETEKNLNRLFDAAHERPMVLQFDEADSLFGRRGEVREARDRYANLEVSHLLARIESHRGPCVLTTNMRRELDPAFTRRFQVLVDFPRPDAAARTELWRRLLPPRAPREPEVIPERLGEAVGLNGGGIRNAALHAAYLAAGAGRPIALGDVALAVWRELAKDARAPSAGDLGALADHLPEDLPR